MHGKNLALRLLLGLLAGALGGILAFLLDEGLAWLTLGSPVPVFPRHIAAYGVAGAVAGVLTLGVLRLLRRAERWSFPKGVATALLLVYAPPLAERIFQALEYTAGRPVAWVGAGLVPCGLGAWAWLLHHCAGRRWIPAAAAATLTASLGLAVNRNLVQFATEPKALLFDGLILAAAVAMATASSAQRRPGHRWLLLGLATAAVAGVLITPRPTPQPLAPPTGERPPHLILVVIDTLRYDVFRDVVAHTPEGNAFHAALGPSAWFTNAVAAAPWTIPSMGSLFTGLYPREHGLGLSKGSDRNRPIRRLAPAAVTLAERLRNRRYWTEGIAANPLLHPTTGIQRGFLHYEVLMGPTVKLPLLTALGRCRLLDREYYQWAPEVRRHLRARLGHLDRQVQQGHPLFLYLHLMDPHDPLYAHPELPPDPAESNLPDKERRYRQETRYALAELTRMFAMLQARNVWDDALVVVVADHGEMFPSDQHDVGVLNNQGEAKTYGHGHAMFEELLHIPLVIRPPGGLPEDREVTALTSHVDLFITLGELLALDLRAVGAQPGDGGEQERVSLAPWLAPNPPEGARVRAYALSHANQIGPRQRALREGPFKLIHYLRGEREDALFDLTTDPQEQHDLATERPADLEHMQQRLQAVWDRLGHPPETDATHFDPETRRRLKALGYLQ